MIINKITKQIRKKNRFLIHIDELGKPLSFHSETIFKHNLQQNSALSEDELENMLNEDNKIAARDSAWRLLSVCSRSSKELKDRLTLKNVKPKVIDDTINKLENLGYVNDDKFAFERASFRCSQKKGPALIRQELKLKGISNSAINDVLIKCGLTKDKEVPVIKKLISKKMKTYSKKLTPNVIAGRLMSFLTRRGFSLDAVREALEDTIKKEEDNQE